MPEIKFCQFNMDTACIDVIYENGKNISVCTIWIEKNLRLTTVASDKLQWLIDNEPLTYVKMALDGTMQEYVDNVERQTDNCESNVRKSLEKHYSPEISRQIAREMMMYG